MNWYLVIAIALIVFIGAVFFISFVHNRRTPVPEGCEQIKIEEMTCLSCSNEGCSIKEKFEIEKIKKELDEDKGENTK